jgi:imidazolonepropionase-like amidohydrolase
MVQFLLFFSAAACAADEPLAIKAGQIITVAGNDLKDGVILIKNGKIEAVGQGLEIPWNARVIEAEDKTVMPGLVLAHTSGGLDRANENLAEVPFVSVFDALDPVSTYFEDALRDGVTTLLVMPGNNTLIGGTGLIVKPHGRTVEAMLVKRQAGLKISLRPYQTSRMGHLANLREAFLELREYLRERQEKLAEAKEKGEEAEAARWEEIDPKRQAMVDLIEGRLPAFVYCERASDVVHALEFMDEQKFKMIPVLGPECYKAAPLLGQRGLPAILDPPLVTWEKDEATEKEEMRVLPQIFMQARVRLAFQTEPSAYGSRYLWFQAATAVKYGMPRAEALRAITLNPAQIIGLGDRVGSIEKGKDANLLLLTGDPLDVRTWVDTVLIEGEVVYERSKDERLQKLLTGKKE